MKENDFINIDKENEEGGFDIQVALGYLRANWLLFVMSIVVCLSLAFVYLRYATPIYNVSAKVLLQDSQKGGSVLSPSDMLMDFGMQGKVSNVENEIELMSSLAVVRGAVLDAELYIKYYLNEKELYKKNAPFAVSIDEDTRAALNRVLDLKFVIGNAGDVKVSYEYDSIVGNPVAVDSYPFTLNVPAGNVLIERNDAVQLASGEIAASVTPIDAVAARYKKALSITPLSKTASVAVLSYNTPIPAEGADFLNAVIVSFNDVTNETKRLVACRTEVFISERLKSLKKELEEMEGSLAAYKKQNELIDPKLDASQVIQRKAEYVKLLEQIDLKIQASKYMNNFVNDPKNDMQVIPASFGVELDPALVSLVNNYNAKVIERKTLLQTTTEENPVLKNATTVLRTMQSDLRTALQALDQSLSIERKAVSILADKYTGRFEMSPEVERQLLTITRECDINSGLYVMLLQKYEETLLSIEVQSDNLSCIDTPLSSGIVAPSKKKVLVLALLVALVLPVAFIYISYLLRNKFATVDEVQAAVKAPFLGSIPLVEPNAKQKKSQKKRFIVVEKNKNDVMAEAFRTLRTNLQFVMRNTSGKVIMFTSTISGEGKTFIAANLAVSTVLLGKKVLLVGCDIRRPRLAEMFNLDADRKGLTSYLAAPEGDVQMLDQLIVPSKVVDGLDVLTAGIVPPNPAELLSGPNLDRAVEYLREKYDYIIFDAAPVGLVADSLIASRIADSVAYVVRLGHTFKADAKFIESLIKEKKLENVSVVVNGENLNFKSYGYSTYGGRSRRYGNYGYAGYGYTHFDKNEK